MCRISGVGVRLVVADDAAVRVLRRCCDPSGPRCEARSSARSLPPAANARAIAAIVAVADTSRRTARRTRRRAAAAPCAARRRCRAALAVERVADAHAARRAVAERVAIARRGGRRRTRRRSSRAAKQLELVSDERPARDVDERLRHRPRSVSPSRVARPPARIATGSVTRTPPWCLRSRTGSALPGGRPGPSPCGAAGNQHRSSA